MTAIAERTCSCLKHSTGRSSSERHGPSSAFSSGTVCGLSVKQSDSTAEEVNERAAQSRHRSQALFIQRMEKKVFRSLTIQVQGAAQLIARGQAPVPTLALTEWPRELFAAEILDAQASGVAGASMANAQLQALVLANQKARTKQVSEIEPVAGIGTADNFLINPRDQSIADYVRATSKRQARTHADQMDKTFAGIRDEQIINPETGLSAPRGLSPAQIAKEFQTSMYKWDRTYANMVARTTTVWAHNEGAQQSYIEGGVVTHKRWYATADERTCPFCAELHGRVVGVEASFAEAGDQVVGQVQLADGSVVERTLQLPEWETEHPPLHPYCRCTIIPEIQNLTSLGPETFVDLLERFDQIGGQHE